MIDFVNPLAGNALRELGDELVDSDTKTVVAKRRDGLFRFVPPEDNYADNFGFQWNTWHNVQSESRGSKLRHSDSIKQRSGLWDGIFPVEGKTLLECGMGGGDDTESLLTLPLAEIHSFDLSTSVDRAAQYLSDPRLRIFQASIYEIPYPPESFDVVWCHRVIQHTPDPEQAMRCVCRMVKPGGFLFIHCYKRSRRYMQEAKYKYRWLTKRLPKNWVYGFVQRCGWPLHILNRWMARTRFTKWLAYNFVPFYAAPKMSLFQDMSEREIFEWEKLVTFDALTPQFDLPMTTKTFTEIIEDEGFEIVRLFDPPVSPLLARAIKKGSSQD